MPRDLAARRRCRRVAEAISGTGFPSVLSLEGEQLALTLGPPPVAADIATLTHHPMARNDQGDPVPGAGTGNRANRSGAPD